MPLWSWSGIFIQMKNHYVFYEEPIVEAIDIKVEQGFAASPGNEGVGENEGNGGFEFYQ